MLSRVSRLRHASRAAQYVASGSPYLVTKPSFFSTIITTKAAESVRAHSQGRTASAGQFVSSIQHRFSSVLARDAFVTSPFSLATTTTTVATSSRLFTSSSSIASSAISPSPITRLDAVVAPQASDFTLRSLLNDEQKALLQRIKNLLARVPADLSALSISKADAALLREASDALEELFLVVVVGEFNSGKSNFINALLGDRFCRTGVLPTTETVQILRYGPTRQEKMIPDGRALRTVHLPVPWLRQLNLVDTPGTNAVLREHQAITERFIPSADMVLFVTSVERPFTESEKAFLTRIHDWRKKVVLVLNKADIVVPNLETVGIHTPPVSTISTSASASSDPASPAASSSSSSATGFPPVGESMDTGVTFPQVVDYVRANAKTVLHEAPPVFGVSSRVALDGKLKIAAATPGHRAAAEASPATLEAHAAAGRALVANSGFLELEKYILSELTNENKVKIKLESPLAIVERLIDKYEAILESRVNTLTADTQTRELLQAEVLAFKAELHADFKQHMHKLENVFLKMKQSSDNFIENNVHLMNITGLVFSANKLKDSYDQQVNQGVTNQVDLIVQGMASWIVTRTARHAQALASIMQRGALYSNPSSSNPIGAVMNGISSAHGSASTGSLSGAGGVAGSGGYTSTASSSSSTSSSSSAASSSANAQSLPFLRPSINAILASANEDVDAVGAGAGDSNADKGLTPSQGLTNRPDLVLDVVRQADFVRTAGVDFHQSRLQMLGDLQRQCREVVDETKRMAQTERMVDTIRQSLMATAAVEVSAMGLGAIFATIFFDATGLAGAGALALAGLVVLPSQRSRLSREMNAKIDALYSSLSVSLQAQFEREIDNAQDTMAQAIHPYFKWVDHENDRLIALQNEMRDVDNEIREIRKQIGSLEK